VHDATSAALCFSTDKNTQSLSHTPYVANFILEQPKASLQLK